MITATFSTHETHSSVTVLWRRINRRVFRFLMLFHWLVALKLSDYEVTTFSLPFVLSDVIFLSGALDKNALWYKIQGNIFTLKLAGEIPFLFAIL